MAMIKWEPLREIEDIFDRYSRAIGLPMGRSGDLSTNGEWCPRVDISENETCFQVRAEIPGVQKKDVKVTLENGVLTLEGERRQEKEEKGLRFHRMERSYGNFIRSFTLPAEVDQEHLKAHFHDGLLEVDIPKTSESRSRCIQVPVE